MTTAQSAHLKSKFILAFAELGNVKAACKRAGVTRRKTVYDWREIDTEFAAAWDEAEILATETLEAEAWRRAVKGVRKEKAVYWQGAEVGRQLETEYSDTLMIFLLKARAPEKYRERSDVTLKATVEDATGLSEDQRVERLARLIDSIRTRADRPAAASEPDMGPATGSTD